MVSPPSYGKPDKSPLAADGSDFPCKATSTAGAPVTDMAIGQQQTLSFNGTAVHGGGSCQISLTTDSPATKGSKWMTIHSIEGGCPARNQAGNLPEGADPDTTPDPDTYKYSIPSGVAPGAYTLAWTWFNKVGNREMYMNCASIKVSGGGSGKRDDTPTPLNETEAYLIPEQLSERDTASFPSMFVANIGTGCTTADGSDLKFPDPGASVETNQGSTFLAPVGNCAAAAGSSSGASSGNTQSAPSAAPSVAAAAPSSPAAAAAVAPSVASPAAGNVAPSVASPAPAPSSSDAASTGSDGASTSSCTTPGQSICSPDGTQIGTCAQSNTVTWTKVAAGTKCEGGNVVAAAAKRSVKFLSGYLERV